MAPVEYVVRGVIAWDVHGLRVIEVLRGDRLGEMRVRRGSGVDGRQRREGRIKIRRVEGVRGLVDGCGPEIHETEGRGEGEGEMVVVTDKDETRRCLRGWAMASG